MDTPATDARDSSACDRWCLGCGYVLNHLETPRCPECGRKFDPGNPLTFRSKTVPEWVRKRLAQKTFHTDRWRALAIALLIPVMMEWPGVRFLFGVSGSLTLVMFFYFAAAQRLNVQLARQYGLAFVPERRRRWLWALLLLAWPTAVVGQPGLWFIHLERPALEAFCHHLYTEEPYSTHAQGIARVGVLLVPYKNSASGVELRLGPYTHGWYAESADGTSRTLTLTFDGSYINDDDSLLELLWPHLRR